MYAITFQENCIHCGKNHLEQISKPFIETLHKVQSAFYVLASIFDTRQSVSCEISKCISKASLHGTTLMMVLVKSSLKITHSFQMNSGDCSAGIVGNEEKGIAVIGLTLSNRRLCLGGLHLDVNSDSSRKKCFVDMLQKLGKKCDVSFFGGDFNVRPSPKSEKNPNKFEGGKNQLFLEKMKETDEFSGSKSYTGEINFLKYVQTTKKKLFVEPFNKTPQFLPTYSLKSSLKCKDYPICYNLERFPAWTDRIIYYPESLVKCSEYTSIPALAEKSDHIPIFANCEFI